MRELSALPITLRHGASAAPTIRPRPILPARLRSAWPLPPDKVAG